MRLNIVALFLISILIISCKTNPKTEGYIINKSLSADSAMVVSAHPLASQIGLDVLKKGGNAIDAAIAVQFALSVCYPIAGNIGGGGFMVYREANGQLHTLDFREKAPKLASEKMYQDENGEIINGLSTKGHLAVGVPGSVDGMYEAYKKFSKLKKWSELLQPSIKMAEEGFAITANEASSLNYYRQDFKDVNNWESAFTSNSDWKTHDLLIQKELATVLKSIQTDGRDGFYDGRVAELLTKDMKKNKGLITKEDLKSYHSVWRDPITFKYRNYKMISMPPPSSGGIALAQLFESIEPYRMDTMEFHSPESVHLMVEAERRTYADRASHLGDSDFVNVPTDKLIDSAYIVSRMANFDHTKASISENITAGIQESEQTTHFSIIDAEGNAVSITTTLNTAYGSKVVVKNGGFFLNNEMDDFSSKPGTPNHYGLIGDEANKIEPNKRMLSSMTPTIIEKDGKLFMVVGTPGGSTIITSVFQTIVNVIDFKKSVSDAVNAQRFHHQWLPDTIQIEEDCLDKSTLQSLESMGHAFRYRGSIGRVEAIVVSDKLEGAADPRGDDSASGY